MNKHNDFTETNNATQQIADSHQDTSTIHTPVDLSIDTRIKAIAERKPESSINASLSTPKMDVAIKAMAKVMNQIASLKSSLATESNLDSLSLLRRDTSIKPSLTTEFKTLSSLCRDIISIPKMDVGIKAETKGMNQIASLKSSLATESNLDSLSLLRRDINKVNLAMMSFAQDLQHNQEMMKRVITNMDMIRRASLAAQPQIDAMIRASLDVQSQMLKLHSCLSGGAAINAAPRLQESPRLGPGSTTSDNESLNLINHQPPTHEVFRETRASGRTIVPAIPKERSLEELLWEINPNLLNPLQGAREALNTNNPDRVRHIAASLRELIGYVLRQLAPDNNIQAWSTNPHYYNKGKPTRRARLLYIYREINSNPLSKFVDDDVTSVLTLIDKLSVEVHAIPCRFTDRQLQWLVNHIESLLLSWLRLNSNNKS